MVEGINFETWLEQVGIQTERGRNSRTYAVDAIERNLTELGIPCRDLTELWKFSTFEGLFERLRKMKEDARTGGQDYRILMPDSKNPHGQLSNWINYLEEYVRFMLAERPEPLKDADRIRQYVLEEYIEPARDEGREQVNVLVNKVHKALGLKAQWPNVCQALNRGFQGMARVSETKLTGPNPSSSTVFHFRLDLEGSAADTADLEERGATNAETKKEPLPMNLILYGPPGTGKTFATAQEAVGMCGEQVPENRAELMAIYQRLVAEGRIEFVTFHQSMSYEDFVEGRQPTTESDGDEETASAGFRLETVPGIFRRIAKRAETSRGRLSGDDAIRVGDRQIFRMSLGEANNPEEMHLFEDAINGNYAIFGFYDIDWSDKKYESIDAIFEACRAENADITRSHGAVWMTNMFRNKINKGDIVIVSKGTRKFRAIGEFTGDYKFHPRPNEPGYAHRRAVRWFWKEPDGVSADAIYDGTFGRNTIHKSDKDKLNIPALERYINSQRADGTNEPEPFVLIIDEINRANISKVFGELITLLEPDKRLGQDNELKVRLPYSPKKFGVPSNLHILGTMNTADRSIALLDVALRRRFAFREIMPDSSLLAEASGKCGINLQRLLDTINERIEYLYDREHQIGHAYFMGCNSRADVDDVMRDKVIPLLAEYFFEDWTKIAAVLGDLETHDGSISGGFLDRSALKAPPGLEDGEAVPRFRWRVRDEFDYAKLTG